MGQPAKLGRKPLTMFEVSLIFWFFGLKTPGNARDFLGDHFARVESSGDQKVNHVHLAFSCFFSISDPPKKSQKSRVSSSPSKPRPLGPCPDDRAQNSVQDSLNESSVRPNPTLVFF